MMMKELFCIDRMCIQSQPQLIDLLQMKAFYRQMERRTSNFSTLE
jgi:hypothetical protein